MDGLALVLGICGLLSGTTLLAMRLMLNRLHEDLRDLKQSISAADTRAAEAERKVERLRTEFTEKLENYVRRDDWIRLGTVLDTKMDKLRDTIEERLAPVPMGRMHHG